MPRNKKRCTKAVEKRKCEIQKRRSERLAKILLDFSDTDMETDNTHGENKNSEQSGVGTGDTGPNDMSIDELFSSPNTTTSLIQKEQLDELDSTFKHDENQIEQKETQTDLKIVSNNKLCVPDCKYNGVHGPSELVRCFQCMTWVHPECCGAPEETRHSGPYSCSLCRQIYKRILGLEIQMETMHNLNKELLCLLEKSQNECENLRFMLQTMMNDKHSSSKKKEQTTNTESEVDALSTGHSEQSLPTKIKLKPCTQALQPPSPL